MSKMGEVAGAALIAVGAESVHMATEYESVTTRLVTSAGEQNKNLKLVQQGMLDMAGQVGVSAIDLAKAMYYVESAGFHGAEGLTVLKAAAQGAAAEGADTTTVVKALTDVLVDYHMKASDAADVTSKMITAVSFGKTSLQDFSGAFASIVPATTSLNEMPAASAAGISFNDVAAALAEMTNHGFTANRASQNLAQALRSLLNPTGPMTAAFQKFGVSSEELRQKLSGPNGLTDAMEYLSQKAEKAGKEGTPAFAAALKLLMGTAPGANAALATVGENFKATSAAISGIGGATKDASGNVKGFAEIQTTLGQKLKELQASFGSLMIQLGDKLLPILKQATDWMLEHQHAVIDVSIALAALLAAVTVVSAAMKVGAAAQAAWSGVMTVSKGVMWLFNDACIGTRIGLAALAIQEGITEAATWGLDAAIAVLTSPITLVIAAVAALVAAFIYLWDNFAGFRDFWKDAWHDIQTGFFDAWHGIDDALHAIGDVLTWLWHDIVEPVWHGFSAVVSFVWDTVLHPVFGLIAAFVRFDLAVAFAVLKQVFGDAWAAISQTAQKVWNDSLKPAWGAIVDAAHGMGAVVLWLWHNVMQPAWAGISAAVSWAWDNVIKPAWAKFSEGLGVLKGIALDFWHNVIEPAWAGIGAAIQAVWQNVIRPIFVDFEDAINTVTNIFNALTDAISGQKNAGNLGSGLQNTIDNLRLNTQTAPGGGAGHSLGGMAAGGAVGAAAWGGAQGGWTWMNEQGKELVHLPMGATVLPHANTVGILGGAGYGAGGGGRATGLEIHFGGDTDGAFATAFMNLVRIGRIQIKQKAIVP